VSAPTAPRFEVRLDAESGERYVAVSLFGEALLDEPRLNKGTCFPPEERERFGLSGLLPAGIFTPQEQAARAYGNFRKAPDDVGRYIFLSALQDRNETLFYRLLAEHLEEMVPIVYTPTVGKVCETYSQIYRRPRGVYLTLADRGRVADILQATAPPETRVLVVTDNEAILGLGDLGVGGMPIAVGKLVLYTVGAGVHPWSCLPVDLDVGTDNRRLLEDPLYLGARHERERGPAYWSLLDELAEAVGAVLPQALVQWEDFSHRNAYRVLERYRHRVLSFNDDVQGTGAVVVAGILSALARDGRRLEDERVVFLGAGASGGGSALAVRAALRARGLSEDAIGARVLALDSKGLLVRGREGLPPPRDTLAADPALVASWGLSPEGPISLLDVVRHYRPSVLVGASGQPGAFTEEIVREMRRHVARPVILPLSNPTDRSEACPADLLRWTEGAALVGTGSPFPPVAFGGRTYAVGQGNNALVFPGVGLGAIAVGARELPDDAFVAAAEAIVEAAPRGETEAIFPPLARLQEVSRRVARRVARRLVHGGFAPPLDEAAIDGRIEGLRWEPRYLPYRPAGAARPSPRPREG
jgi:malic enzyme